MGIPGGVDITSIQFTSRAEASYPESLVFIRSSPARPIPKSARIDQPRREKQFHKAKLLVTSQNAAHETRTFPESQLTRLTLFWSPPLRLRLSSFRRARESSLWRFAFTR